MNEEAKNETGDPTTEDARSKLAERKDRDDVPEWKRIQAACNALSHMGKFVKVVHASERKKTRAAEAQGRQALRKIRKRVARNAKAERLAPVVYAEIANNYVSLSGTI